MNVNRKWARMHGVKTDGRGATEIWTECKERFGIFCENLTPKDGEWPSRLAQLWRAFDRGETYNGIVKQMVNGQGIFHRLQLNTLYRNEWKYAALFCWEIE